MTYDVTERILRWTNKFVRLCTCTVLRMSVEATRMPVQLIRTHFRPLQISEIPVQASRITAQGCGVPLRIKDACSDLWSAWPTVWDAISDQKIAFGPRRRDGLDLGGLNRHPRGLNRHPRGINRHHRGLNIYPG